MLTLLIHTNRIKRPCNKINLVVIYWFANYFLWWIIRWIYLNFWKNINQFNDALNSSIKGVLFSKLILRQRYTFQPIICIDKVYIIVKLAILYSNVCLLYIIFQPKIDLYGFKCISISICTLFALGISLQRQKTAKSCKCTHKSLELIAISMWCWPPNGKMQRKCNTATKPLLY